MKKVSRKGRKVHKGIRQLKRAKKKNNKLFFPLRAFPLRSPRHCEKYSMPCTYFLQVFGLFSPLLKTGIYEKIINFSMIIYK
jgi:hypothetical protein